MQFILLLPRLALNCFMVIDNVILNNFSSGVPLGIGTGVTGVDVIVKVKSARCAGGALNKIEFLKYLDCSLRLSQVFGVIEFIGVLGACLVALVVILSMYSTKCAIGGMQRVRCAAPSV